VTLLALDVAPTLWCPYDTCSGWCACDGDHFWCERCGATWAIDGTPLDGPETSARDAEDPS
jgi:hypothetical protein